MKRVAILGSTGSIGTQTLDVISALPQEFDIVGLATGYDLDLFATQIKHFKPEIVSVADAELAKKLTQMLGDSDVIIGSGIDGLTAVATYAKADIVVTAVSGAIGLLPTVQAIKHGKTIALANKETLVAAGELIMDLARQYEVKILPLDSEHNAIFQCLHGEAHESIAKIILTASGGPFRTWTVEQLQQVTPAEALKHPKWKMGPKITIDSATLMNKGLEVIEAKWLFNLDYSQIEVVIHPQSVIHSMVEFCDGSILAQLGVPDMRVPIHYALTYPKRLRNELPRLKLLELSNLTFEAPDLEKFPCLELAFSIGRTGGTLPAVMNAANEIAVHEFINNNIRFTDIPIVIEKVINAHQNILKPSLDEILAADRWAREKAKIYC